MKYILHSLWDAIVKTVDHDGVEHAGYMSFMVILSLFPFFIFMLALTSFFGASELGQNFIEFMVQNIPDEAVESFMSRIEEISNSPPQSLLTLAVAGTIWTASSYVECLRTILNRVYEIRNPPNYIFRRLLSVVQFLIISLAISAVMFILVLVPFVVGKIPVLVKLMNGHLQQYGMILNWTRNSLVFFALFLTASSLYYIVPNARISFMEVTPGAALCVVLWAISGSLLSKYIKYYNQLSLVYGSLGSVIITLLFFFVVNMIFIYGAEFNYLLKKRPT